jgi:hypothetical protein
VQQLAGRITLAQEKAIRAKFHLEGMLPWDGLSQLAEYTAVAEREGADSLATMLGRFRRQIEPLLVAGRCVRRFSQDYPQVHAEELLSRAGRTLRRQADRATGGLFAHDPLSLRTKHAPHTCRFHSRR